MKKIPFILIIALTSCNTNEVKTESQQMDSIVYVENDTAIAAKKPSDPCSELHVGGRYVLYGYRDGDPFNPINPAPVTITAMKDGWVQYCWTHQLKKEYKTFFTRSCPEFVDLMNNKR